MLNRIILLVGLPGSGKSTFSEALVNFKTNWQRVNQDDMGSRKACEINMRRYLKEEANVVVDRCNFDVQQRKTWINLAHEYKVPIDCIVLTTTKQECVDRIKVREQHPTGVEGDKGVMILHRFVKNYYPPTETDNEGFQRILYLEPSSDPVCTVERIDRALELLDQSPLLL